MITKVRRRKKYGSLCGEFQSQWLYPGNVARVGVFTSKSRSQRKCGPSGFLSLRRHSVGEGRRDGFRSVLRVPVPSPLLLPPPAVAGVAAGGDPTQHERNAVLLYRQGQPPRVARTLLVMRGHPSTPSTSCYPSCTDVNTRMMVKRPSCSKTYHDGHEAQTADEHPTEHERRRGLVLGASSRPSLESLCTSSIS